MKNNISIIIPVHNNENTIKRCVGSIIKQQDKNVEIIIVENNSTDYSKQFCSELAKENENVRFFTTNKMGVSAARNIGLENATGDIIGFCDADDYYENNYLEVVRKEFSNDNNIDILVGGVNIRNKNESIIKKKRFLKETTINDDKLINYVLNNKNIMGSCWNKAYKRNIINGVFFNEELSYCEDTFFNVEICSKNKNLFCKIINEVIYNYCLNENSVTLNKKEIFDSDGSLKYNIAFKKMLKKFNLNSKQQKYVNYAICKMSMNNINNATNNIQKQLLMQEISCNQKYLFENINCEGIFQGIKNIVKSIYYLNIYERF